jgi:uncharacterized protein (DUF1800 family)
MAQLPDLAPGGGAVAAPEAERRRVARLFHRAGFGATTAVIDQWAAKGYAAAVDGLLAYPATTGRPDEAEVLALVTGAPAAEVNGFDMSTYQRWWLDRMATTAYPLEEKLTLYWHGHFATAFSKVKRPRAMLTQNKLLRDLSGGNFRELAKKITTDAAMLIWLDGNTNQLAAPNENYGREFMELFTLGKDRYTQEDVRQAARAFTGYTTDGQGNVVYNPELHDPGPKVILGQAGNWAPLDVADIVLDRHPEGPVAAHYLAHRLAGFLHRPDPEPGVVEAMAAAFAAGGYEIKPMVRALLMRPEFMDGPVLTIKSPAELVAGAIRALDLAKAPTPTAGKPRQGLDELAKACEAMGQDLFNPPNVAGWKGGSSWANTATTLARYNFAAQVAKLVTDEAVGTVLAAAGGEPRDTTGPWMHRLGLIELMPTTGSAIDAYLSDSAAAKTDAKVRARGVLTLLLASPDYNLR